MEKEKWDRGNKTSTPEFKVVSKSDFASYNEQRFFEMHGYTVEILHDPSKGEGQSTGGNTNAGNKTAAGTPKKKEDWLKELAVLLQVEPSSLDPKLTIKQIQDLIKEHTPAS